MYGSNQNKTLGDEEGKNISLHHGRWSRDEILVLKKKIPLTIREIIFSSKEELSDLFESHTLTEEQINICRDIRRRGRNKESINAWAKEVVIILIYFTLLYFMVVNDEFGQDKRI